MSGPPGTAIRSCVEHGRTHPHVDWLETGYRVRSDWSDGAAEAHFTCVDKDLRSTPCSLDRPIRMTKMGPPLSHAKTDWALDPGPCLVWEGNLTPVVLALWEVCGSSREGSTSIVGQLYHYLMRLPSYQPFAPLARLWVWIYLEAGFISLAA